MVADQLKWTLMCLPMESRCFPYWAQKWVMHVNFSFRHFRETFSSRVGDREDLKIESKVLNFLMELPFSPRAVLGRLWKNHGGTFRILPGGMVPSLALGLLL